MHCTKKQEVDWKTTPHHMLNLGSGDTKTPDVRYDSHMVLCTSVRRKCISGYHGAWRCIAGEGEDAYCNLLQWLWRSATQSLSPPADQNAPGGNPEESFLQETEIDLIFSVTVRMHGKFCLLICCKAFYKSQICHCGALVLTRPIDLRVVHAAKLISREQSVRAAKGKLSVNSWRVEKVGKDGKGG